MSDQPGDPVLQAGGDPRLPMLQDALSVETMTANLRPLLLSLARPGSTPTVTHAKLLAHNPGNRGVIQYEVAGTERRESCGVLGKVYPEPSQAARVYSDMKSLWDDVFCGSARLSVPQPLGYLPALSMLVYLAAEGRFLDEVIAGDQAFHFMELAGAWLGTLHQHRLSLDRQFQLATELVNIQAWAALIGCKYPDAAEAARRIAGHLHERANDLRFETHVPIHKDFHYGHVIVNGELKVIDFDEMRLGDPNFDLAHFCANFDLLALRKGSSPFQFPALQSRFLAAYARHTGWTLDERFMFFYVYTCLKIAKQLCKSRGPHPRPEGEEQRRQVRLILAEGLAALRKEHATSEFVARAWWNDRHHVIQERSHVAPDVTPGPPTRVGRPS